MDPEIHKRLERVKVYEQTRNAGITCLRYGISRPTLRQWWQRLQSDGVEGLKSRTGAHDLYQAKRFFLKRRNGFCL